jgi:molecular chaperone GrpE
MSEAKEEECGEGKEESKEKRKEKHGEDAQFETLSEALEAEKKRSEEYLTRLKYMQADFENLKKRLAREMEETRKLSNERLIVELLGVVDELEVAVKSGRSSKSVKVIVDGVEMTLRKLKKVLENEQVSPIESVGTLFDPSRHDAISRVERKDVEEGKIVEEVRKGYIMRGKVIRPSSVKIAVNPPSETQPENETDE